MLLTLLGGTGCSMLRATVGAYEVGPNGIAGPQLRLREALARSDFRVALGWEEGDALLHALNVGVSSYYASQFARSAAVLDSAARIADDRITQSISQNALAMVTNDMARAYQPRRTERLFIPYYGMLAYARLGQWEDAAVEARRMSGLLAQYAEGRSESESATHATLHYLTGAVYERAGEIDDARVAYRLARAIAPGMVDSAQASPLKGSGEVLLVVERGFVAHRTTESVNVFFGDSARRRHHGDRGDHPRESRRERDQEDDADDDSGDDDGYWLSVALPSVRRSSRLVGGPSLSIDGTAAECVRVEMLLDDAVAADETRERAGLLARAVARASAKYVVTKAVKDKKGDVAGRIVNIGASLMERADVRSWHLLPQEITILRVRSTPGQHRISVEVGGVRIDAGSVNVSEAGPTIVAVRAW